jgi:hypothetical protein
MRCREASLMSVLFALVLGAMSDELRLALHM